MEQKTRKKSKAWIPFVIILVTGLGFLGFRILSMTGSAGKAGPDQETQAEEETVFAVNTTWARQGELKEYLNINGDIIATDTVDVYPDATGKLVRITVKLGDPVKKDQVIAWIDPSRPGMNYSESPVKSPINGTVTAVNGRVGAMVTAQVPLISVGDLSSLKVRAYIPERFTSRIALNMPASLVFETFPGETFSARISEISPVVDPISRTMEVRMQLTGPLKGIKAGMFSQVSLILATKARAVRVPASCIVSRFDKTYVFTVREDRAVMQPVSTGITEDGVTEILSGVQADEEIVYQGVNLLEDQAKIRIIERIESLQ